MRDEFMDCLGIENFTVSLGIGDVIFLHGWAMEWADAIHRGDEKESEYYRGRFYGFISALNVAHQLKHGYTHKKVFEHFEKFATDWGHDERYWVQEIYDRLNDTYEYFVTSAMERDDDGDIDHANAMKNALDYIKGSLDKLEKGGK